MASARQSQLLGSLCFAVEIRIQKHIVRNQIHAVLDAVAEWASVSEGKEKIDVRSILSISISVETVRTRAGDVIDG